MLAPSKQLIKDSVDPNEDSSEEQRKAHYLSRLANRESNVFNPEEFARNLGDLNVARRDSSPRPKRREDPREQMRKAKEKSRKNLNSAPVVTEIPKPDFCKMEVLPLQTRESKLSAVLKKAGNNLYNPNASSVASNPSAWHKKLTIRIFFEEVTDVDPLVLQISCPMTVEEVINLICNKVEQRGDFVLGGKALTYELRYYEEDDGIDYDLPPLSKEVDIFDVGQEFMALCRSSDKNLGIATSLNLPNERKMERERGLTLPLNQHSPDMQLKFVKIYIPGPTDAQSTLKLTGDSETMRVRDLYSLLNRKMGGKPYSSAYFGLYYLETPFQPLNVGMSVAELRTDKLYLMPREQTFRPGSEEYDDAMDYPQISLLEYKTYSVSKVNPSSKKKRTLGVDRSKIVKIVQDSGVSIFSKEHLPINITDIDYINMLSSPREFEIAYRHPSGQARKQTYECKTTQTCEEFVNRICYLMRYVKLRPAAKRP